MSDVKVKVCNRSLLNDWEVIKKHCTGTMMLNQSQSEVDRPSTFKLKVWLCWWMVRSGFFPLAWKAISLCEMLSNVIAATTADGLA